MMRATVRVLGGYKYPPPNGMGHPELAVEIARTPDELLTGLSGRPTLTPDTGMLFDMGRTDLHGFHMVGVHFPLDILFVHATEHGAWIFSVAHQVQPGDPGPIMSPRPCRWIVEAPGGWCREHGVHVDDRMMMISVVLL
jgi:uncharacterized membrane protein (UPF0127 family)